MKRTGRAAAVTLLLLLLAFAALVVVLTPWHPLPGRVPGGHVPAQAARDFSATEIARETSYHDSIRPYGLTGLGLSLLVPMLLGFTPFGRRLVARVRPRHWLVQTIVAVVGVTLATTIVTIPLGVREHQIQRHYRLTYQDWGGWAADVARSYAVVAVTTAIGVVVIVALARRLRRGWWLPAAALGAALVVGGSFVYPYVVEPLFNHFRSMPPGPLREQLLALAEQDHQPLRDILVADASRRTTTENAYVSGFGASRRLVIYDTLLARDTPAEVRVVVAHELGHAKRDDVLVGTIEGALVLAAAMCALFLLMGASAGDPRFVPLILALYVTVGFVVSPLTNVISRHIEARADAHALQLTRDPQTFIAAQKQLAVTGLDDLKPSSVLYVLFFDHPTAPQRIAMARDWSRQHP